VSGDTLFCRLQVLGCLVFVRERYFELVEKSEVRCVPVL
jgi:hypothetical protein